MSKGKFERGSKPEALAQATENTVTKAAGADHDLQSEDSHTASVVVIRKNAKASSGEQSQFRGFVDLLTPTQANGWAWLPSSDAPVSIAVVQNGQVLGRSAASEFRQDLAEAGLNGGLVGFNIQFEKAVDLGDVPAVYANVGGRPVRLPLTSQDSARGWSNNPPGHRQNTAFQNGLRIEGYVDNLSRNGASGWAWAPALPQQSLEIEAYVGDEIVGRATASTLRDDLLNYKKGTGRYGFTLDFFEVLRGEELPRFRALLYSDGDIECTVSLPALETTPRERPRDPLKSMLDEHAKFTSAGPLFEEFEGALSPAAPNINKRPTIIAYYLPQFHAIPENDGFWGSGFTEWRQLNRGMPRFPGHYQPRTPRDLGFYTLDNADVLRRQAEFALKSGVGVFAYYYYWFNGKRVLEAPLETHLKSDVEMPFLLIWANENWTRTWDGAASEVLLRQDYEEKDELALLTDWARHFSDHRYFRIEGRPLFVIYNPKAVPECAQTVARWRKTLEEKFDLRPIMLMAQTFGEVDPVGYGLDGALEFPPHKLTQNLPGRTLDDAYANDFRGRVIPYEDIVTASLSEDPPAYPLIKTAIPSWDNEARRPNRGMVIEGSTPQKYQRWLEKLLERAVAEPLNGVPLVAINAWNEWAEGTYLEPDVHFGSAYLNATARALQSVETLDQPVDDDMQVSVVLPNFNHAKYLPSRLRSVLQQTRRPNEIIFLDDCSTDDSVEIAREILSSSDISFKIILNESNSGTVFRQWWKGINAASHDLIWIAETDDSADKNFLKRLLPAFQDDDTAAAFGRMYCIDENGAARFDLDSYFDDLDHMSWRDGVKIQAFRAFMSDFAIKNIIPNASGLVFRKPDLAASEVSRLFQYSFAGDWYFYMLLLRGGALQYCPDARSFFRISRNSASRSAFQSDRHLREHAMILEDLTNQYPVPQTALVRHAQSLHKLFAEKDFADLSKAILPRKRRVMPMPMRVCIAAHSFAVGGGEVAPLELANALKEKGHHVTYLILEDLEKGDRSIRERLRRDISVVRYADVAGDFDGFLSNYGIEIFNSHNISIDYRLFVDGAKVNIPYVASLHGGYEATTSVLSTGFLAFLQTTVKSWLYLSDKNKDVLAGRGIEETSFHRSFNAVAEIKGNDIQRKEFLESIGVQADAFAMVICSRAIEAKGWQIAIDILRNVRERGHTHVHLVLIGSGVDEGAIRARNLDVPNVTFLGHVDRPSRYLHCFDLGLFPSRYAGETFPLFILECFQAGIPVVSTDIGEIPAILSVGGKAGLTVDHSLGTDGVVAKMTDALLAVLEGPSALEAMKEDAKTVADHFSLSRWSNHYEDIFRRNIVPTGTSKTKMKKA